MLIGGIAALLAALSISITAVCYAMAGRKTHSSIASMALSLPLAWALLVGLHLLMRGAWFPPQLSLQRAFYLGASGVLAFVVASYFMLNAFQAIGPRLASVILSFTPVLVAVFAWVFLGEALPAHSAIGIVVVIAGIVTVVAERGNGGTLAARRDARRGVILACLATLIQAIAFIFAAQGLAGGFPPISATLTRITAATATIWLLLLAQNKARSTLSIIRGDWPLLRLLTGAALSGPVISGLLLLFSFQFVPVGVSTTLSHTTSIMLIPISYCLFHERITLRAIIGTFISVAGIGLLFL